VPHAPGEIGPGCVNQQMVVLCEALDYVKFVSRL